MGLIYWILISLAIGIILSLIVWGLAVFIIGFELVVYSFAWVFDEWGPAAAILYLIVLILLFPITFTIFLLLSIIKLRKKIKDKTLLDE